MANWIIVVDDDVTNLKTAGHILSRNNMRVTALKSGQALLDYPIGNERPDMILLDIKMPDMDGFETLRLFRRREEANGADEIPVVFLTADEDAGSERLGFEAGVADYIRKPFDPDVLVRRINNIISSREKIVNLKAEASTDALTGFLNKSAAGTEFPRICADETGCLMMIDLDSFKLVNDIYGHEMGDKVLKAFAEAVSALVPEGSRCARIGGDEFTVFCSNMVTENAAELFSERLNAAITDFAKKLMGDDMSIPLGASVGGVFVPKSGKDYEELLKYADKSLYLVKQNGKHGCSIYSSGAVCEDDTNVVDMDINTRSAILGERTIPIVALQLDKEQFAYVYRYVMRYIVRNQRTACKVLLTLSKAENADDQVYRDQCDNFGTHIKESLRKSDILMRSKYNQYFIFLTDIRENSIGKVISNIISSWHELYGSDLTVTYETEFVGSENDFGRKSDEIRVTVVDDDTANLKMAGVILSKAGFYVTALKSGSALLKYVEDNTPDLILLDIKMPDMDGFETIKRLKNLETDAADIPVVFLTSDESNEAESMGLSLGAMDFIKKPFVPEVLTLRVRHIVELVTLQKNLSFEVERKTRENRNLFLHVVKSLADAIDAKDTYTNGHSGRVAEYSKEIAKRAGYSLDEQNDIYMMGLLHDVGKIGVPDAVINKPAKLTDEEFALIKNHPVMGAKILENIKEMPKLATGARWHHERYGGGGYPDGLEGTRIPEEARIIAVADAYDAMSSRRSYRDVLPQATVRYEIENGRGTQFDPKLAETMLDMMDEDKDNNMSEH